VETGLKQTDAVRGGLTFHLLSACPPTGTPCEMRTRVHDCPLAAGRVADNPTKTTSNSPAACPIRLYNSTIPRHAAASTTRMALSWPSNGGGFLMQRESVTLHGADWDLQKPGSGRRAGLFGGGGPRTSGRSRVECPIGVDPNQTSDTRPRSVRLESELALIDTCGRRS